VVDCDFVSSLRDEIGATTVVLWRHVAILSPMKYPTIFHLPCLFHVATVLRPRHSTLTKYYLAECFSDNNIVWLRQWPACMSRPTFFNNACQTRDKVSFSGSLFLSPRLVPSIGLANHLALQLRVLLLQLHTIQLIAVRYSPAYHTTSHDSSLPWPILRPACHSAFL
jgi:hypothetical protein